VSGIFSSNQRVINSRPFKRKHAFILEGVEALLTLDEEEQEQEEQE
jgi:hypothetical protein